MKTQLRGRIRREVVTLLEAEHRVLIIGLASDNDFLQGLSNPNLEVRLLPPWSIYNKGMAFVKQVVRVRQVSAGVGNLSKSPTPRTAESEPPGAPPNDGSRPKPDRMFQRVNRAMPKSVLLKIARLLRAKLRGVVRRVRRVARMPSRGLLKAVQRLLKPWHRITFYQSHWKRSQPIVEKWSPDIVHSCDLDGLVGAARAARRLHVPHIHDCHELFLERSLFTSFEKRVLGAIEKRWITKPDVVTVVNQSIGEQLAHRYGIDFTVIRNCAAVPPAIRLVDLRPLAGLPGGANVVLYQGGLLEGRGLDVLIRSAVLYPENVALVLLGYGGLRKSLEQLTRELDVEELVRFVDAVPPDELLHVTASADVGIVPYQPISLNNKLALPNKIFEYLSVGVPVVAADIPELRRIVLNNRCGSVYDPFDPVALSAAVAALLNDGSHAEAVKNAFGYAKENSWEIEREILLKIYRHVARAETDEPS